MLTNKELEIIHSVPLPRRLEMVSKILETISIPEIVIVYRFELSSTVILDKAPFTWRAWKLSGERPIEFLINGGLDRDTSHWWPHAPYPPKDSTEQHKEYLAKYDSDPITRGAFMTAVILACKQKEAMKV